MYFYDILNPDLATNNILNNNELVIDKVLSLLNENNFCFYAFVNYPPPTYLTDFIVGGPIDQMLELWNIEGIDTSAFAEMQLNKRLLSLTKPNEIQFLIQLLYEHDIGCWWLRQGINYDIITNYGDRQYEPFNPYYNRRPINWENVNYTKYKLK